MGALLQANLYSHELEGRQSLYWPRGPEMTNRRKYVQALLQIPCAKE